MSPLIPPSEPPNSRRNREIIEISSDDVANFILRNNIHDSDGGARTGEYGSLNFDNMPVETRRPRAGSRDVPMPPSRAIPGYVDESDDTDSGSISEFLALTTFVLFVSVAGVYLV